MPDPKSGSNSCYVAFTSHVVQISEDSYKEFAKTRVCTRDTTLGELVDWYRLWNKHGPIDDLHISEATGVYVASDMVWRKGELCCLQHNRL